MSTFRSVLVICAAIGSSSAYADVGAAGSDLASRCKSLVQNPTVKKELEASQFRRERWELIILAVKMRGSSSASQMGTDNASKELVKHTGPGKVTEQIKKEAEETARCREAEEIFLREMKRQDGLETTDHRPPESAIEMSR